MFELFVAEVIFHRLHLSRVQVIEKPTTYRVVGPVCAILGAPLPLSPGDRLRKEDQIRRVYLDEESARAWLWLENQKYEATLRQNLWTAMAWDVLLVGEEATRPAMNALAVLDNLAPNLEG